MAGTMSRADLVATLKASLMDAAALFKTAADADFVRHLDVAAQDMHRVRPRRLRGNVTLVAGETEYAAPADMIKFVGAIWEPTHGHPWEKGYIGVPPRISVFEHEGAKWLALSYSPSQAFINYQKGAIRFNYIARDVIGDAAADTTIRADDRALLILRAQVEAMNELALRDSVRPVSINNGFSGQPKTGTPAAVRDSLMTAWLFSQL